ncbi:MAG: GtrA family protein [Candidatus Limnocylindria bacterium]
MARATMTRTIALRPRSHQAVRFGLVGFSGLAVNQLALAALSELLGIHYLLAAIGATQVSSSWNFVGTERWVFSGRQPSNSLGGRFTRFIALNNATLLGRLPLLWLFTEVGGIHYLWANAITLALLFFVRFAVADGWIWSSGAEPESMPAPVVAGAGQRFAFSIAGLLRIESDVPLRELAYFRTEEPGTPDLVIHVGRVGALPIRKTRFVESGQNLKYLEQLGAASANFQVTMGEPIEVRVAPLLASSPHVLYTNVIEALLRFLLVSRGHVLLHSACVMVNGRAVLLSAQTDTGKTSTVIQLVRDRKYQFLSDDMTIISPDGVAITYPKPMTMSYHTMSAISGHRLPMRQRAALAIQSRLHSKSGRTVGRRLGEMNIPIMSLNSVVQWMVPPPKYHIASLIDCELAERAPIGHVFVMDRGEALQERIDPADAVETLIENTDDAYEFPPFSTFAPHLRIGSDDYVALRRKESELLRRAVARADVWHVRVPGHEWSQVLPTLIEPDSPRAIPIEVDETLSSHAIPIIPIAAAEELIPADPLAS